jgi:hypothetical protein
MRRKRALTRALAAEILRERGGFDVPVGIGASRS